MPLTESQIDAIEAFKVTEPVEVPGETETPKEKPDEVKVFRTEI